LTIANSKAIPPQKMANTKSAIKTLRRIKRQTLVNKSRKNRFKSAIKKMNVLIEKKNKKNAISYLPKLNSELMKIAKTGIIKKERASRNLSRITRKINSL
tara:strand:- start:294 stop:593 length:300 start_codon:yes stop_codon:yes gene_type:complete